MRAGLIYYQNSIINNENKDLLIDDDLYSKFKIYKEEGK